jgi:hypothetical protein
MIRWILKNCSEGNAINGDRQKQKHLSRVKLSRSKKCTKNMALSKRYKPSRKKNKNSPRRRKKINKNRKS